MLAAQRRLTVKIPLRNYACNGTAWGYMQRYCKEALDQFAEFAAETPFWAEGGFWFNQSINFMFIIVYSILVIGCH